MSQNTTITFRLSEAEKISIERDADRRGLVLSTWIRLACSKLAHADDKKSEKKAAAE